MHLRLKLDQTSNIALTGSTGYVGGLVGEKLSSQLLTDVDRLQDLPSGTVLIHLAAIIAPKDDESLRRNIEIDQHVIEWANETDAGGVVYASGNNVYGNALGCRVDDHLRPVDNYSASKVFGEMLIRAQLRQPWAILRIGDVFGKGQRHGNLFRAVEKAIADKQPIRQFGEGLKLRNYVYGKELAAQILHGADLLRSGQQRSLIWNAAHSGPITVRDLLRDLSQLADIPLHHVPVEDDKSHLDIRSLHIEPLPNYNPHWTLSSALQDYVNEIRAER